MPPASPRDLPPYRDARALLARYSLAPKRAFSQNFLVSRHAVEAIAEAATAGEPAAVIELGAGLGTLTLELMRRAPLVVAIERDSAMIDVLQAELAAHGLLLLRRDAADLDYRELQRRFGQGRPVHVAGNLPYAATGAILRRLIDESDAVASAVLMVQREVRDRLLASPGTREYGALSVFCRSAFAAEPLLSVPATAFVPRPKVVSAVVRLTPLAAPPELDRRVFGALVHAAFQQRRKTLRNALSASVGTERAELALSQAAIDGRRRGETLSLDEFVTLSRTDALREP